MLNRAWKRCERQILAALLLGAGAASVFAQPAEIRAIEKSEILAQRSEALKRLVDSLQDEPSRLRMDPLYVPREALAGKRATGVRVEYRAPLRRWPEESRREDPDRLLRRWEQELSPAEMRSGAEAALRAPSEPGPIAAGAKAAAPRGFDALTAPDKAAGSAAWSELFFGIEHVPSGRFFAGRASQVARAYDPLQGRTTLWAGTAGGGLYKIVIVGIFAFWVPVSDTLPGSPSVGSFVVRPSDGEEILVGTGDWFRFGGDGIYKTVDGGATWVATPASPTPGAVHRLQTHRLDDEIVLAATVTGIYRSTDFGDSWTRVSTSNTTDIAQDPVSPQYWYAAVPGVGVLESSDHGASFHAFGPGCSPIPGPTRRIEITVAESAPNYVYAVAEDGTGALNGIYRSSNYGCTWTSIDSMDTSSWGQAFHAIAIEVDPTNPARLFVGMGGGQFTDQATSASPCWYRNGSGPSDCGLPGGFDAGHADQTDFLFDGGDVLITNDGGVFRFDPDTRTVQDAGNGLGFRTLQTMSGLQHLTTSFEDPTYLLAGLQDNGVVEISGGFADFIIGGDGGVVSISPDNKDHFYASYGIGWQRAGSHNGGDSLFSLSCGLPTPGSAGGFSGVYREPTPGVPPSLVYLFTLMPDPASGGDFVWFKTPTTTCDWQKAHGTSLPFTPVGFDQNNDPRRWSLYAWGWRDRRVAAMDVGGPGSMSWVDRTPPGIDAPASGPGADMRLFAERSGSRPGTAYYTTANARPTRAFVTDDRGVTWREVTGNLPIAIGGVSAFEMAGDPRSPETLFVATDVGVFRTDTAERPSPFWYRYMEGMPAVSRVLNLEVSAEGPGPALIRAGTYGHGFWEREIASTGVIFVDGFESGSTAGWSGSTP